MGQQGYNVCREANRGIRIDVLKQPRRLISVEEFSGFFAPDYFTEKVIFPHELPETEEACSGSEPVGNHIPSNV